MVNKIIKKKNIPKAIKQHVWLYHIGTKFQDKCTVKWCNNTITVFNYHTGHNIPESKGGTINIDNLRPICSNCNLSMNDKYSIDEWNYLCIKNKNNIKNNSTNIFFKNIIKYLISFIFG